MKKLNLVKLIKKYKKTSFFIFLIFLFSIYNEFSLFYYDTTFKIYNKSNHLIKYTKAEIPNVIDPMFSDEELSTLKSYYDLTKQKSITLVSNSKYWRKEKRRLTLNFYTTDFIEMNHASFIDEPTYPNQKPSCSFKIEVYPDKTVVTPTYKRFCKKPMYNYENFNPYNPKHQSQSY
ncbi:hypothetical protein [Moraxella equi]|uniref:Uncharacterized protein n=1 Tax=Moraxella equi TaxID=60442 RepID=A0A378QT99_9GAMM|nr:hypothetical protein [Moraxella equi]OPH39806.1 hypothetical protein B5J93_02355 [Moraxella equi]STZ03672.1 Uncharacterised protein [Moraxella equi]